MTACAAFWRHLNLRSGDRVFPCCRYKTAEAVFKGDFESVIHSDRWQQLRRLSVEGTPLPGCEKCYHEEKIGRTSLRQKFNQKYDTESVSVDFLEIGFDNICNLTCDGCGPEFSTAWAKQLDPSTTFKMSVANTSEITKVPDSVKKVLFLGGEPLMTNRHRAFLERISFPESVEVTYNTNGMFELDDRSIDVLSKFKSVEFIVSVDGIGALNDRVRSGSDWVTIQNSVTKFISLAYKITIHTTVHANNWHGLSDVYEWTVQHKLPWSMNVLTYPPHLDIRNLSDHDQDLMHQMMQSLPEQEKLYLLGHLTSRPKKNDSKFTQ